MTRDNIMEITLARLKKEADGARIVPLAKQMGIPHVTLWRILNGKSRGNVLTWAKIFKYYKK